MSVYISKVYTKTGDRGETALVGGKMVKKGSDRIEAYGTVDELNAVLGLVRRANQTDAGPEPAKGRIDALLERVQSELFNLGCELATPDPQRRTQGPRIEQRHVDALERDIDAVNDDLPVLKSFVLPGGGPASAHLHLARTVCRRCERIVVALGDPDHAHDIAYLNRLSDALFVWGRWAALKDGRDEPLWDSRGT